MFDNRDARFLCMAILTRLSPSQRWWFSSCTTCHKSSIPDGAAYRCSDQKCAGTDAIPRYRICYIARDDDADSNDPGEAEFVFFDRVGRALIGAPLIGILRHGRSSVAPLQEIVHSARGDPATPRELAAVISRKFRFVVSISNKCFTNEDDELSFQVLRIDAPLGKQPRSSVSYRASNLTTGLTSSSSSPADLPLASGALPGTPSHGTEGTYSDPPSISETPEHRPLLPSLASPPSVVKPSVIGGVLAAIKPKSRHVLFKDVATDLAAKSPTDPKDDQLADPNKEALAGDPLGLVTDSITDQTKSPELGTSHNKDPLPLPDQTSDGKRPQAPVAPGAALASTKRTKKK